MKKKANPIFIAIQVLVTVYIHLSPYSKLISGTTAIIFLMITGLIILTRLLNLNPKITYATPTK